MREKKTWLVVTFYTITASAMESASELLGDAEKFKRSFVEGAH